MKHLWNSAFGLLIVTGGLLGLTLPFGKMATQGGIPAMLWAFVISVGAGSVLFLTLALRRQFFTLTRPRLRYFTIVASTSYDIPTLLLFSSIAHLSARYAGTMYPLSPASTLL